MRILVAGGAGFIGSHLCRYLLEQGDEVICVDSLCTSSKNNVKDLLPNKRFSFIEQDITKPLEIKGELNQVYNMASRASPPNYQSAPIHTMMTSALGNHNLMELALKKKARYFFASTSEVYGDPEIHPQPESYWGNVNPVGVRSCYDEAKRFGEALCMAYMREKGLNVRIVRIFNTYGPNMQADDGRVVSNFINQALKDEDITMYGDGTQTRSFCYVDDLIRGIHKLMNSEISSPVNIGNPNEITVAELARMIKQMTKSESKLVFRQLPTDDPTRRKPDISLAKRELHWEPKISLEEGLKKTIEYFKKNSS